MRSLRFTTASGRGLRSLEGAACKKSDAPSAARLRGGHPYNDLAELVMAADGLMDWALRHLHYRLPPFLSNQEATDLEFCPSLAPDHHSLTQPNTVATVSFASFAAAPPVPLTYHWPLHPAALDPSSCQDQQYSCDTAPPLSPYAPGPTPWQDPTSGAMRVQCHRCGGFGLISRNSATGRRMGPLVCFRCQRSGQLQALCPGNQWR
ncbi:hypothetical protein HPB51_023456 [Rhipicephalus microplus]|uniref:CCHC-type domain-containing protein n=1 Tax=Rhipicephalus microplus TaxID=6941 RepID=A0A9J6F7T4_RHIMP|nr:hypothetical protein HPB51_023456 [Rhipicephalus microplus]